MHEYLKAFRAITQSIQQFLIDENNSLEIKESATNLKDPMYQCLEELKSSATRLKELVQIGCDDLQHAADVWKSKPRIVKAPKQEIWEQVGELSGCDVRIRNLGDQCKTQVIEKIQKSWETVLDQLINQYFVDAKSGKQKDEIFWGTGDVIQGLRAAVEAQEENTSYLLKEHIFLIATESEIIDLKKVNNFINLFNEKDKLSLTEQFQSIVNKIDDRRQLEQAGITQYIKKINKAIGKAIDDLAQQLKIKRKELLEFKDKVNLKIKNIIGSIFDNRVELLIKAIAQVLAFYNDFLERQERYQQETPEQREAEKAWIAQKWGELKKVQNGIEAILNAS